MKGTISSSPQRMAKKMAFFTPIIEKPIPYITHNRNIIFDFEGSDIKGVKEFYKSFGPERKVYPELYIDNSPLWLTLVQKVKQFISFLK